MLSCVILYTYILFRKNLKKKRVMVVVKLIIQLHGLTL